MTDENDVFQVLFRSWYGPIYGHLYKIVGDAQEAEDLTQLAFLRLHQHMESVAQESVRSWLYQTATRLGLNALRDRKRFRAWQERATQELQVQATRLALPEESSLQTEQERQVRGILQQLPEREARMLVQYYAGLKNHRELAEELGVQVHSIGTMLARAKRAFLKIYEQKHQEGDREDGLPDRTHPTLS